MVSVVLRPGSLLHHLWRAEPCPQPILPWGTHHLSHVVGPYPHHPLFHLYPNLPPCSPGAHDNDKCAIMVGAKLRKVQWTENSFKDSSPSRTSTSDSVWEGRAWKEKKAPPRSWTNFGSKGECSLQLPRQMSLLTEKTSLKENLSISSTAKDLNPQRPRSSLDACGKLVWWQAPN